MRDDKGGRVRRADPIRVQGLRLSAAGDGRISSYSACADSKIAFIRGDRALADTRAGGAAGDGDPNWLIPDSLLGNDAPFRRYVALKGDIVGRVRSVDAAGATYCADMYVNASHRRRGIGQALLGRMLRDDRARGSKCSVLTASLTGCTAVSALLATQRIGTLFMFVPRRKESA